MKFDLGGQVKKCAKLTLKLHIKFGEDISSSLGVISIVSLIYHWQTDKVGHKGVLLLKIGKIEFKGLNLALPTPNSETEKMFNFIGTWEGVMHDVGGCTEITHQSSIKYHTLKN